MPVGAWSDRRLQIRLEKLVETVVDLIGYTRSARLSVLAGVPERTKTEFQRLGLRVTMTPKIAETARQYYQADVVNSLPCLSEITEMRDISPSAVDRSDPQSAGSRTSEHWGFRVDLPANHLGPGWRRRA
jgi:hypothetical protein